MKDSVSETPASRAESTERPSFDLHNRAGLSTGGRFQAADCIGGCQDDRHRPPGRGLGAHREPCADGVGAGCRETRLRVEQAAAELGYTVNQLARSLRTQRTWLAVVIVPDIGNIFFALAF